MDGGGAIYGNSGSLELINVTVVSNTADVDNNGTGDGGGIVLTAGSPYVLVWWATIGAALIARSTKFGLWG